VEEYPEHVGADLGVRRTHELVLVIAERPVPAREVEQGDLHVEADLAGAGLQLLEQRLLGLGGLRAGHGEANGQPLAALRPDSVVVPLGPSRVVEQRVRAVLIEGVGVGGLDGGGLDARERAVRALGGGAEERLQAGVEIGRCDERLPHPLVVERRLTAVELDAVARARARRVEMRQAVALLGRGDLLRQRVVDDVDVAALERREAGRRVRDEAPGHALDGVLGRRVEAGRRDGVVRVPLERHVVLLHPLADGERPGSDRAQAVLVLSALDAGRSLDGDPRLREGFEQRGIRSAHVEAHLARADDLDGLHLLHREIPRGRPGVRILQMLDVGLHRRGVDRGAVAEDGVRIEREVPGEAVFRFGPLRGQPRHDLAVAVERYERLHHLAGEQRLRVVPAHMGVEAVGLGVAGRVDELAGVRRAFAAPAGGEGEQERRGDAERARDLEC